MDLAIPAFVNVADNPQAVGFTGPLRTESWPARRIADAGLKRQRCTLLESLTFVSEKFGAITVPAGFSTDLASIPRFAFTYIAPDDPEIEYASVVHDYLYSRAGVLVDGRALTRQQADEILIEGMALCGASWLQRKVVYAAVRVGGSSHWEAAS